MNLGRSFSWGVASSVCSAAMTFVAIPFYIRILGPEAYGVIGFFVVLQGLFQLLDLGMAPTISRQIARAVTPTDREQSRNLVHSLALIYWGIGILAALLITIFAGPIADRWLKAEILSPAQIAVAVALMGLTLAAKWPTSLYSAALIGAERLPTSSMITMGAATAANIGGIVVVTLVSPTLKAFFLWQALVSLAQTLAMRHSLWRILQGTARARIDVNELRKMWAFSAGMTGITVAGIALSQLDKLLLSRLIPLAEFGNYMVATLVASMLLLLARPMFQTIYPRMSKLVVNRNQVELVGTYHMSTRFLASIVFPMAMAMIVYAHDFLLLWVGSPAVAASTAPSVAMLAAGSALNAVMHIPFALQLASGRVRLALGLSVTLVILMVPLIVVLTNRYGAVGGASAWFILNSVYLLGGAWLTHRTLLPGELRLWLLRDVGVPLAIATGIGATAATFRGWAQTGPVENLLVGTVMSAVCMLACLLSYAPLRQMLRTVFHDRTRMRRTRHT